MNIDIIKETVKEKLGKKVSITVKCLRNKKEYYEGVLYKMYPNIFSIMTRNGEKTFSYADVATKDVLIKC